MPPRTLKPCGKIGCQELTITAFCTEHTKAKNIERKSSAKRGYDARWRKYRIVFLTKHPFCVRCLDKGLHTLATVVDHIKPHKGNYILFWDEDNHQSLCKCCHDTKTATEDGGFGRR